MVEVSFLAGIRVSTVNSLRTDLASVLALADFLAGLSAIRSVRLPIGTALLALAMDFETCESEIQILQLPGIGRRRIIVLSSGFHERMSRKSAAQGIICNPEGFQICEGCDSIVAHYVIICPNCHSYNFETDLEKICAHAEELSKREQRSVTEEDMEG